MVAWRECQLLVDFMQNDVRKKSKNESVAQDAAVGHKIQSTETVAIVELTENFAAAALVAKNKSKLVEVAAPEAAAPVEKTKIKLVEATGPVRVKTDVAKFGNSFKSVEVTGTVGRQTRSKTAAAAAAAEMKSNLVEVIKSTDYQVRAEAAPVENKSKLIRNTEAVGRQTRAAAVAAIEIKSKLVVVPRTVGRQTRSKTAAANTVEKNKSKLVAIAGPPNPRPLAKATDAQKIQNNFEMVKEAGKVGRQTRAKTRAEAAAANAKNKEPARANKE